MASARGIKRVKFTVSTRKITRKIQRVNARAMRELAKEITTVISKKIGKQGTPNLRSKPGEPPRRQTGFLQAKTVAEFDGKNKIVVKTPQYGVFLDGGTRNIKPRPFLRKTVHDRKPNWNRRYRYYMRKFSKK